MLKWLKKYIKLETTKKWGYTYKKSGNGVSVSYKTFTGTDFYNFTFKKGAELTISCEAVVEEGELTIEWNDGREMIWRKTFKESGKETFTAAASSRLHGINLIGADTRGSCKVEFTETKV
ncbi:hypothetical protein KZX50_20080 [Bacillus infantis]|uniref:hypothetical protein n=1 Tax=Bacillus infantis TaxID=324767 RepID=UPI000B9A41AF|nr:hypothetical protein [Bacillus infantis]MCK6207743.1 hypothetical protein [Bacillus infantis]OXT15849.1 hypothetical protein B9K06_18910 [Bacillus sp. OG2]